MLVAVVSVFDMHTRFSFFLLLLLHRRRLQLDRL